MLRATLDQMRASAGRLAAAGIAIVLGTAFVAASLLATATMQQASYDAFTATYADADLVVQADSSLITPAVVDAVRGTDGVTAVDPRANLGAQLDSATATEYAAIDQTPSDPRLEVGTLAEGHQATGDGEVVLDPGVAQRLGLGLGDSVTMTWPKPDGELQSLDLTVVGLLAPSESAFTSGGGARVDAATYDSLVNDLNSGGFSGSLVLTMAAGVDQAAVRSALAANPALAGLTTATVTELAEQQATDIAGASVAFLVITLAFASVALAVAGLVITNTFQVLVAQRTRTLALLRCVGASRRQIRGSVLLEAAVLGLMCSVIGLLIAVGVVNGGVRVLAQVFPQAAIGTTVPLSAWVPVITLGVGIAMTVLSALVPARMATRVAPIAALRPVEGALERGAGRVRTGLAVAMLVLGWAMVAGGVALALAGADTDWIDTAILGGLALGVLGGLISVVGLLVGSVFIVPKTLPLFGRLFGRGVPATIATANAVRNPRRTAATTNALVIGVALVVMMSTGALSARETLLSTLSNEFSLDVQVASVDPSQQLTAGQIAAFTSAPGVESAATVQLTGDIVFSNDSGGQFYPNTVSFADGDATVLRAPGVAEVMGRGIAVAARGSQFAQMFPDGSSATITTADGQSAEVTVVLTDFGDQYTVFVSQDVMNTIAPNAQVNGVWLRLADNANVRDTVASLQQLINDTQATSPGAPVVDLQGAAPMRAAFEEVISTLLAIVLGLLAVAVVIALVGVANTLSLSVIERRRENATLRAMGLKRSQLRGMLAVEGLLIAIVGSALGLVIGLLYGWAGAAIVLGGVGGGSGLQLEVPWVQLLAIVSIALIAGLLASVLPARSAVKQSPVAALATD